jgi:ribosomal protein S12 methylthiotransferase accessory factor
MEAIELHHAERLTLPTQVSSYAELSKRHRVVRIDLLPFLNRLRFHEHRTIPWVEGYDLLQEQPTWVPYECVSADAVTLNAPGKECFLPTSNGLASGNHLLEAIVHAICEVVERDATTLWYQRPQRATRLSCININSCNDPTLKQLITRCHESGIQMLVWDTTSDIGAPSFLCLLYERTNDPNRLHYTSAGMGCHLSREVALIRAITEAAQSRLTLIAGARDDIFRNQYEQSHFTSKDLARYCALQPTGGKHRFFSDISSFVQETFNADIVVLLERLSGVGIKNVIVVRLTEPRSLFHIVKVIIPGLEGPCEHPAYSPGVRAQRLLGHPA